MSKADRRAKRRRRNSVQNKTSKLYRDALREGERMERHFKQTVNALPWWKRQVIGYWIMRGRWK
jgi:hypothetical protein